MKGIIKALSQIEKPILFIDEIHMIMGAGNGGSQGQGSVDMANLLKPALAKGTLRCIGSTTDEEYRKHFEKDRALLRRFQKIDVHEPSKEDSLRILEGLKSYYEEFHGVTYTKDALETAVDLTHRYIHDRHLPDKAIDVIDAAGARQRVAPLNSKKSILDAQDIELEVSVIAKIPRKTVHESEADKLEHLDSDLSKVVFDQDDAVSTLTDAVIMARAGLRDPNKPLGSYLFVGKTGCGKTELAKQLSNTLGMELIRFDMSEYMEKHSVAKLIGSPPGYVGYSDGNSGSGLLINKLETNPHSVLLLDEVEKAHPDVLNILLQVMDNGMVTSSSGKVASVKNAILIMTSNAGSSDLDRNPVGFNRVDRDGEDDKVINAFFTPEFRNRLDAIIKFKNLQPSTMEKIVDKFIGMLNTLSAEKGVTVEVDAEARKWLAEKGYDSKMGARPLGRVIDQKIKKQLSREMLFGFLKNGGIAKVKLGSDGLVITS
jgi:ATP-dependent Clp protease ATP-binding subunit ClpA